ncbi:MAG: GtrA family protein [Candidatus Aphodocola sp.]
MQLFKKKEKKLFKKIFRKKSKLEKFYDKNEEFIKYCLVSTICTGILYLVFFIVDLITKGNYLLANFLSYTISFTVLFILDQRVFKSRPIRKRDKLKQLTAFIIVRIIGFPLDSLVLSILINKFGIGNMAAKVLGSLIMFMYNYVTNKLFVFKKNKLI